MFIQYLVIFVFAVVIDSVEIDLNFQDKIPEGEQRYRELLKKAKSYGDCWKQAMSDLHQGCKQLTEEVQSRLALSFSNCFLNHTGSDPCPCPYNVPISVCLKNSSDRVYNVYTEFYTHTHSICHYLQHKEWQAEAAKTVLILTENSVEVSKKLDESSKSQSKILDLQNAALYEQKRLISNNKILNAELQRSRDNARQIYNEFRTTTNEQKLLLFEVFDRVQNLQNFVLGEFTGVYTVVYYLIVAIITYMATSIPRTAEARIWLILVITLNVILERILTCCSINEGSINQNPFESNERIYYRIWLCRKIVCAICFIILIVCYYHYKDYNVINNKLLREIQQQNMEIQMFIKGINSYEGFQNSLKISSTKISPISFVATQEKVTVITDTSRRKINENMQDSTPKQISPDNNLFKLQVDVSTPREISPVENFGNKENDPLHIGESGKKPRVTKQTIEKKRPKIIKSPNITPTTHLQRNILSEFESPGSPRYNLRSSRLNSPQL